MGWVICRRQFFFYRVMYGSAKVCLAVDYAIYETFLAIFLAFFFLKPSTLCAASWWVGGGGTMVVPIYERGQVQL